MSKKTLLIIAAVAVMLVAATSAYGYHEWWNGWFNSGSLEYLGATFEYTEGEGTLRDTTAGSVDSFLVSAVCISTFTCATTGYYIKLWPGASGYKYTGQSGQKPAYAGAWAGFARLYDDENELIQEFETVNGTWNTRADGDYFDYTMCPCPPDTPTYSAHWIASESDPPGL